MRLLGFFVMMLGIVAVAAGMITGCNATLNHNGRHELASYPLTLGQPLRVSFDAKSERRYTAGIQVRFGGEGEITAKLPLVAVIDDGSAKVKTAGFLDPSVPPTTLVHRDRLAERLVGPYPAPSDRRVDLAVDLSEDANSPQIEGARVVLYDDAKPASLALGFGAVGLGVVAFFGGGVLAVMGGRRRKRGRK